MRIAKWLLLIALTNPNGLTEWLAPSQVVVVRPSADGECENHAPTLINLGNNDFLCVMEKPEDVVSKLK